MYKVDLHVHSIYSRDSLMSFDRLIAAAQRQSLDAIALTDHNTIAGAVELAHYAPFPVIIGEEIKTTQGEIIGYYLQETIPAGLSPQETVRAIRDQGGIVAVPHPFDRIRRSPLKRESLHAVRQQVDLLETLNARVTLPQDNVLAAAYAQENGLATSGGSDAHSPVEVGRAYTLIADIGDRDAFATSLPTAQPVGRISPIWVHFSSSWAKRYKQWRKWHPVA